MQTMQIINSVINQIRKHSVINVLVCILLVFFCQKQLYKLFLF